MLSETNQSTLGLLRFRSPEPGQRLEISGVRLTGGGRGTIAPLHGGCVSIQAADGTKFVQDRRVATLPRPICRILS